MFFFWLLILLIILWLIAIPAWPYHRRYGYGYYPFGIVSALLIIFILFWIFGAFVVAI